MKVFHWYTRTKLTQMQSDVVNTQSEVLSRMLSGSQDAALSYDNYGTILETSKSAYYVGQQLMIYRSGHR